MNQLTNTRGFSLSMAVWLAHEEYTDGSDEFAGKNVISATSLLKPTRQIVLAPRVPLRERITDLSDLIAARFGHAVHDSVEQAWTRGYPMAMKRLGYPQKMIDKVRINPETVEDGDIPVYLEQRFFREIEVDGVEVVISGKFDQIIDGELNDTKTTSVYAYINRSKEEDYVLQGSIYRWINPDKVTSDMMQIQHVFTDWQRSQARINKDYPPDKLVEFPVELLSLRETENWIRSKIRNVIANQDLPEPEVVHCNAKELWMSDPTYKYYSDPAKAAAGGRSTRNFPDYPSAAAHHSKMGKGVIITVPSKPRACGYCPAFSVCSQKDRYEHD